MGDSPGYGGLVPVMGDSPGYGGLELFTALLVIHTLLYIAAAFVDSSNRAIS